MNPNAWGLVITGPRGLRLEHKAMNYTDCIQYVRGCAAVAPFQPGTIAVISGPIGGTRRYALRGSTLAELKDTAAVRSEEGKRPAFDFTMRKTTT